METKIEEKKKTDRRGRWSKFLKDVNPFDPSHKDNKEPPVKEETKQEKAIRETTEKINQLITEFKNQTSLDVDPDKLTNAIYSFQFYESTQFIAAGYADGVKGAKDNNIKSSAGAKANFIYEHTTSILSGRIKGIQSQLELKNKQIKRVDEEIDDETKFNHKINTLKKKEHRHFSLPIAIFYIIVGVSMMFADFPISLGISRDFINLPIDFDFSFVNEVKTPEILLFSLGITFLSIYFKILYDEYINKSIIKDEDERPLVGRSLAMAGVRLLVQLLILGGLIYLLYNIGSLRNALNPLSIKVQKSYKDFVEIRWVFNYKLVSFIGMTILLPLLSGICFSVGLTIVSNVKNLKSSNKSLEDLNEKRQKLEADKDQLDTHQRLLESLRDDWNKEESKITGLENLFVNDYLQAYKRGHRDKFGYDIYDNANSLFIDHINSTN
jgi:hypothetical protein